MKFNKILIAALVFGGLFISCASDADDVAPSGTEVPERDLIVENFIYRGMNEIYLYKADVPQLADGFFASQADRNDFLDNYPTPEDLFYDGLTASQDKFSFLVDDYIELENMFSGISTTTGMSYGLVRYCQSCSEVFGYIRYVLPNTSAGQAGLKRGDVFNRIDGQQLTDANYQSLLGAQSFTLGLAKLEGSSINNLEQTASLTKEQYTKNPVLVTNILEVDGSKIGYLMYDSFTADFDEELNAAFGEFKNAAVSALVLDLRYNGGGSVRTASDLAAMITGQFAGEIFMKEQWNEKYQTYFENNNPESLINRFNTTTRNGTPINSLNLDKVYVITTGRSASASELVINGLEPYIPVIQIGETTRGKFQASVTLYDSQNFARNNANTRHTYAIQPLVLKSVNSAGVSDYVDGLAPDHEISENYRNLGTLGEVDEPMLNLAINVIQGNRIMVPMVKHYPHVGEDAMFNLDYQRMYIDELPGLRKQE